MTTSNDPPAQPPGGWGPPPGWAAPPPTGYGTPAGYGTSPGYGAPAGYGQHGQQYGPTGEDTTWALLVHLSFFVLGLIAPLVVYLVKKESPFVRQHAAEAFDFHLTITLAMVVSFVLMVVLIGFVLLPALLIAGAVLSVLAAVAAGRGQQYRYPFTLRLLR